MGFPISLCNVELVSDRKFISDTLSLDRLWAAEALISLDDRYWILSSWYGYQDGSNFGLALMFNKMDPTPVFFVGEPNCLAQIIRSKVMPKNIFVEAPLSCIGVLNERFQFGSTQIMSKMQLEMFRPHSFSVHPSIRKLTAEDFSKARDLYHRNIEGGIFDADQFNQGHYYGVQHGNQVVSMAGTTVLCTDYRTATIGNVITDHAFRNHGYARSELVLLCQKLLEESFDCICLKVNRGNIGAIALYRRIGFMKKWEYFEGIGVKKAG